MMLYLPELIPNCDELRKDGGVELYLLRVICFLLWALIHYFCTKKKRKKKEERRGRRKQYHSPAPPNCCLSHVPWSVVVRLLIGKIKKYRARYMHVIFPRFFLLCVFTPTRLFSALPCSLLVSHVEVEGGQIK